MRARTSKVHPSANLKEGTKHHDLGGFHDGLVLRGVP